MKAFAGSSKLFFSQGVGTPNLLANLAKNTLIPSKRGPKRPTLEELGIKKPGQSVAGGFTVQKIDFVKEFDMTVVQLSHEKTGACYLHIDSDDTNNAFGITFRTPAKESTGVAHILEHVVLCGSERFPVRDPFFKMLKRSMNTYMNAMTAQDYTTYPFSTVVEQDFHNLLEVYLDCAFFPLLKKTDFLQEGHRLEFRSDTNQLKRTGVVYNEMKGHLSDSSSLYSARLQYELFGDSIYGHNSGGDWKKIPDLTYERLLNFHRSHYHPSNALFVSYGDLPLIRTLERVDQLVLSRFQFDPLFSRQPYAQISQVQSRPSEMKNIEMIVPGDSAQDDKLKISRAWMIQDFDCRDLYKNLAGRVLASLLLEGSQAPIHSSLIDSQIAPGFSPSTGFETSNFTPTFCIGASGVTDIQAVEDAIAKGLTKAYDEGFSKDRVSAVIHQMELSLRHKRANFGLLCIYSAAQNWCHAGPDILPKVFHVTDLISQLKQQAAENPSYWKDILQNWVLIGWDNYHIRLIGKPSNTKTLEDAEEEERQVQSLKLTEEQLCKIKETNFMLEKEREAAEDISVLPTLEVVKDVPLVSPEAIRVTIETGKTSANEVQRVLEQKTNGITYLRAFFDHSTQNLSEFNEFLPLLCKTLGSVDTSNRSYQQLDLALESTGGHLSISPSSPMWLGVDTTSKYKHGHYFHGIFVNFDCLTSNRLQAFEDVLSELLTSSKFNTEDGKRLQTLISSGAQSFVSSLSQNAPSFARAIAKAPLNDIYDLQERLNGYSQMKFVLRLNELGLDGSKKTAKVLQTLSRYVLHYSPETKASYVDSTGESIDSIDNLLNSLKTVQKPSSQEIEESLGVIKSLGLFENQNNVKRARTTYLSLPVPVHYCCAVVKTDASYGHVDDAALTVLAQLASYDYLHQHIREKGGAYGSGAYLDSEGLFYLTSFWDPNSTKTLETFSSSLKWLCDGNFTEKQVDEALLSIFSSLDAPSSPSKKGLGFFLHGITPEMKDAQREKYFDLVGKAGISKLKDVAQKHLSSIDSFISPPQDVNKQNYSVCIVGKKETGESEFSKLGNWKIIEA